MSDPQPRSALGVKLDPTVNYGHLISATVFLVTAAMAWANLSSRQDNADQRIAQLERAQQTLVAEQNQEARVVARLDEKITNLDRVLRRIEALLDARIQRGAVD